MTEGARNQETHGKEAVDRSHDESVETRKLSSKGSPLEGARTDLRSVESGSRNRQWFCGCHDVMLISEKSTRSWHLLTENEVPAPEKLGLTFIQILCSSSLHIFIINIQ